MCFLSFMTDLLSLIWFYIVLTWLNWRKLDCFKLASQYIHKKDYKVIALTELVIFRCVLQVITSSGEVQCTSYFIEPVQWMEQALLGVMDGQVKNLSSFLLHHCLLPPNNFWANMNVWYDHLLLIYSSCSFSLPFFYIFVCV